MEKLKKYFLVALLSMASLLPFSGCNLEIWNKDTTLGSKMQDFELLALDSSSVFKIKPIAMGRPTVIVFFEPYCPHCRAETESIMKNINQFDSTVFCFLSVASIQDVKSFYDSYKFSNYSNIHVGVDTSYEYMKYFNINNVPHTSVYNKDHVLIKVFSSKVDAEEILKAIKK